MNYKKFIQESQKKFGFTIVEINNVFTTIKCNTCGAVKNMQNKSFYKNFYKKEIENLSMHNFKCSEYYINCIKKDIGIQYAKKFHNTYRFLHERCFNQNCKDFDLYNGKCDFTDFTDFYLSCYSLFKDAINKYPNENLSIDRIDGTQNYKKDNIRFVPMRINLQNKDVVKPVKMTDIETCKVVTAVSFGELAKKYGDYKFLSGIFNACKKNHLFHKKWKIEYIETQSTTER